MQYVQELYEEGPKPLLKHPLHKLCVQDHTFKVSQVMGRLPVRHKKSGGRGGGFFCKPVSQKKEVKSWPQSDTVEFGPVGQF